MRFKTLLPGLLLLISCSDTDSRPASQPVKKDSVPLQATATNPYLPLDVSPMDMIYLPDNYPVQKMMDSIKTAPVGRIIFSRPHKQGRRIFGALIKYGEPWRLGANEATELELFQPVMIQKKLIPQGRYVLYCIPQEKTWTIVFNKNLDAWGLKQDPRKDVYRFDIQAQQKDMSVEYFSMVFEKTPGGADLVMAWDNVEARLPVQYIPSK
jgi:hypothetical protein